MTFKLHAPGLTTRHPGETPRGSGCPIPAPEVLWRLICHDAREEVAAERAGGRVLEAERPVPAT